MEKLVQKLALRLKKKGWYLVVAESCTGGGLGYALTEIPGSSAWFERGFITYSNAAKEELLGVKVNTLQQFGAVSAETAEEMALGALQHSKGQLSVAITGIAGPEGGTTDKPVGLVWFGFADIDGNLKTVKQLFSGDRTEIRKQAIQFAIEGLIKGD